LFLFFFQAEDGIRDGHVTGVQTCALPILPSFCLPATRRYVTSRGEPMVSEMRLPLAYERAYADKPAMALAAREALRERLDAQRRSEERRVGKECRSRWLA